AAVGNANGNGSGDNLVQGHTNLVVRAIGLYGNGQDSVQQVLGMKDPAEAAAFLRAEEARRIREIRQTVVASVNNVPARVDDLVDGGPALNEDGSLRRSDAELVRRGVVVGVQTRQGKVSISRPKTSPDPLPRTPSPAFANAGEGVRGRGETAAGLPE